MMKDVNLLLAANLRKIREERNLSLGQLAELSGVSKSMLGQIERGEANPSIGTIWQIANGLRVSFTSLLNEENQSVKITHKSDTHMVAQEDDKFRLYSYVPFDPKHKFELYTVELEVGCVHESDAHVTGVDEYLLVHEGIIEVEINGQTYHLKEGDAITFVSDAVHTYRNVGDVFASATIVLYYPE
jgi:transcriptional regulator with XRE-family HTH domain